MQLKQYIKIIIILIILRRVQTQSKPKDFK